MRRLLFQYFLLIMLIAVTPPCLSKTAAASPSALTQATAHFRSGRYVEALSLFQKVEAADLIPGVIGASRTLIMTGQYGAAEAVCRRTLGNQPGDPAIISQLAEVLAMTGRSDEAMGILESVVRAADATPASLVKYGQLLQLRGRRDEAAAIFQRALSLNDTGHVTKSHDLAMLAVASRALERFYDANRFFRQALRADPQNLAAEVLWGDLFQEKYNTAEARKSYAAVLKDNPKHVPALVGMARTLNGSAAQKLLEEALTVNASSESALEALAKIAIDDDRWEKAKTYLDKILEINRESVNAHTLQAVIAYLEEDGPKYTALQQALAQFSPGNARFYARIAEICGRKYRFEDAVHMARLALKTDPQHNNATTILGMNLLRLGREEEGRRHLEQSFESDPFNIWTMNMLRVLDVLADFETRRTEHFIVRMHSSDAATLWPYLESLLEESWQTLTQKYEFTPKSPILVEVFPEHEDFAVRTSGLPDIGPVVGVCFGEVITLDSPRALKPPRSMNWQEIVWHEFTHVITLQMAHNRLPRWLSEGISVFEEHKGRPEWGRRQDLALVKAVQQDRILPVKTLNEGFSKAKSTKDLSFAYYQSYLVVEYIVERYGFQSLKDLIYQYRKPKQMEDIFVSVFEASLASFEKGFRTWLEDRVRRIDVHVYQEAAGGQGGPNESEMTELEGMSLPESSTPEAVTAALRKRIAAQPRDFEAHFQLGLILSRKSSNDDAITHLKIARDLLPHYAGTPNPRQVLADIYQARGDEAAMLEELEALVHYQQEAYDACYRLAKAYLDRNNDTKAIYFLERAIAVDPYQPDLHRLLASIAYKMADHERAVRGFKILTALEDTDPVSAYTDLAKAHLAGGNKKEAKNTALLALEIAPTFEPAQNILLDSLADDIIVR
ncbi:MAG: tetratricopeptide repeat protein [Desulfobacterales bacterium]|jgi:tetratricopeptide (TPR) repeat protein